MKQIVLKSIKTYQKYIPRGNHCRFYPTCSEFTYGSILKYGTIKGLLIGLSRILRCHPVAKGGYDPVK